MKTHNLNIRQDIQHQMFFVKVKGGSAYLKYEKPKQDVLDYKETYVPVNSRDQGVATELAAHALDYASARNFNIVPSCPFIRSFIKKNPEYKDVVISKK